MTVYRLIVAESTLELHRHKRDLCAYLLEGDDASARLTEDELIALCGNEPPAFKAAMNAWPASVLCVQSLARCVPAVTSTKPFHFRLRRSPA